jgi:hypothetical protein
MSGSASDFQWFIARDGKQHGPVTDAELKKIIELAHLKPTDLVWRQGFTDWRAASSVFPELAEPVKAAPPPREPSPPAQAAAPTPAADKPAAPAREPTPIKGSASQHYQPSPATGAGAAPQDTWRAQRETTRPDQMATRPLGTPVRPAGPLPAGPGPASLTAAAPGGASLGAAGPTMGSAGPRTTTESRRPADLSAQPRPEPPPSSRGRKLALVATGLLAMTGVGAWLSSEYKDEIFTYMETDGAPSETGATATTATANAIQPSAPETTAAVQPVATNPHSPEDIDRKLQSRTMWVSVKQEFPDWYQARIAEVARLSAENKDQSEITRYLVGELVSLRRENAKYALAASTTHHKELASAFLANLTKLSQESGDDCYEFISKGESSPSIISRMEDPAKSSEIEAQVVAVLGAIADGKKQPSEHAAPVKTDYDVLAGELGRLGWTQADMQLFANPKALAQAPRARVCSMLKDWFTAHLAIQDPSTQERLLFETLKPVISG